MLNTLKNILLKLLQDDIDPIKKELTKQININTDLKNQVQTLNLELNQKDVFINDLERQLRDSQDIILVKENKISENEDENNSLKQNIMKLEQELQINEMKKDMEIKELQQKIEYLEISIKKINQPSKYSKKL